MKYLENNIPIKKQKVNNDHNQLDWKLGITHSNTIVENQKLGVNIFRYNIIDTNSNNILYDTIGIKEQCGGCVILLLDEKNRIGLIKEWRPIPEKWFWACIRGFSNGNSESILKTAQREIIEEIGSITIKEEKNIGKIYSNTSFFETPVNVILFKAKLNLIKLSKEEGIVDFNFFLDTEIDEMIINNEIECQFTLSVIAKFFALKKKGII